MQNKIIILISFIFSVSSLSVAMAADARDSQSVTASVTTMGDEALASYISGRLKLALKDDAAVVEQYCDASGCAVVVQ